MLNKICFTLAGGPVTLLSFLEYKTLLFPRFRFAPKGGVYLRDKDGSRMDFGLPDLDPA